MDGLRGERRPEVEFTYIEGLEMPPEPRSGEGSRPSSDKGTTNCSDLAKNASCALSGSQANESWEELLDGGRGRLNREGPCGAGL
jgi:hypothetical protein